MGFDVLFLLSYAEFNIVRDYNLSYESLVDIVVLILLSIALLIVIVTPVFFIFCWVNYSLEYVKEYRSHFSLKKWFKHRNDFLLEEVPELVWIKYRSTYARMVGFGFSVLAYAVTSITYMLQNFSRLELALVDYFSFPFKVIKNLDGVETNGGVLLPMEEVWMEMFYIVVISIIFFLVGYIYGSFLVDFRLKRVKKSRQRRKNSGVIANNSKLVTKEKIPLTHFSSIE